MGTFDFKVIAFVLFNRKLVKIAEFLSKYLHFSNLLLKNTSPKPQIPAKIPLFITKIFLKPLIKSKFVNNFLFVKPRSPLIPDIYLRKCVFCLNSAAERGNYTAESGSYTTERGSYMAEDIS